jgi:hypothetical protein
VKAVAHDGHTALHDAALRGDRAMMRLLVTAGARLDVGDADGRLPIHWAVSNPTHSSALSFICDTTGSTYVNAASADGMTPVMVAAYVHTHTHTHAHTHTHTHTRTHTHTHTHIHTYTYTSPHSLTWPGELDRDPWPPTLDTFGQLLLKIASAIHWHREAQSQVHPLNHTHAHTHGTPPGITTALTS